MMQWKSSWVTCTFLIHWHRINLQISIQSTLFDIEINTIKWCIDRVFKSQFPRYQPWSLTDARRRNAWKSDKWVGVLQETNAGWWPISQDNTNHFNGNLYSNSSKFNLYLTSLGAPCPGLPHNDDHVSKCCWQLCTSFILCFWKREGKILQSSTLRFINHWLTFKVQRILWLILFSWFHFIRNLRFSNSHQFRSASASSACKGHSDTVSRSPAMVVLVPCTW